MRPLGIVTVLVLGLGGLLAGWVKYQEHYGLFFPRGYSEDRLASLDDRLRYRTFGSQSGPKLTGLLQRGDPKAPLLVMAHGNAGHMLDRVFWFRQVLPEGWSGFIFDYRGYGRSEGSPSVKGLKADTRRAVEYGLETTGSDTLFLHGRSLGVPMMADAARYHAPEAMILESGFPTARDVVPHVLPIPGLKYLVGLELDTVRAVRTAQENHGAVRKLVVHGTADRILPVELGRALYGRLSEPKDSYFVEGAGHNDLPIVAGERYGQTLKDFLRNRRGSETDGGSSG